MDRFDHHDDGYLRWIEAHPSGLVINCYPDPSTDYLICGGRGADTIYVATKAGFDNWHGHSRP